MTSTYSPNLLEIQGFNENSTTWGLRENTNLSKIDNMINGWLVKDLSAQIGVYILTALQSQLDEQSMSGIRFQGLLTTGLIIRIPSVAQEHVFWNDTTGGFSLSIGTLGGVAYTLPPNAIAQIRCDGSACFDNINHLNGGLSVGGALSGGALSGTTLTISGNSSLGGTTTTAALAAGNTAITGTLTTTGAATLGAGMTAAGNGSIGGTLSVGGILTANSSVSVATNIVAGGNAQIFGVVISSQGTLGSNGNGHRFVLNGPPSNNQTGVDGDMWFSPT